MRDFERVKTITPWGQAQGVYRYARGINFYITASHGGFKLSEERNKQVRQDWKNKTFGGLGLKGWYEEDEDQMYVVLTFPELFSDDRVREAERMIVCKRVNHV